jgi:hypothetical protein
VAAAIAGGFVWLAKARQKDVFSCQDRGRGVSIGKHFWVGVTAFSISGAAIDMTVDCGLDHDAVKNTGELIRLVEVGEDHRIVAFSVLVDDDKQAHQAPPASLRAILSRELARQIILRATIEAMTTRKMKPTPEAKMKVGVVIMTHMLI